MAEFHRGFEDVDRSGGERNLFGFLDRVAQVPSIAAYRARMLELCPVTEGFAVLDVGCGVGHEAINLSLQVGDTGKVIGIDSSEAMVGEARRRALAAGVAAVFQPGDAHALAFPDSHFDLCRAERVFLYLEDPEKALEEVARVLRPGGRVAIFDFDYNTFFIDSDHGEMTRHLETLLAGDARNPLIGRELPRLMRGAGLQVRTIEPVTLMPTIEMVGMIYRGPISRGIDAGAFTAEEVDRWWAEQETMDRQGTFFHAHRGYITVAAKP